MIEIYTDGSYKSGTGFGVGMLAIHENGCETRIFKSFKKLESSTDTITIDDDTIDINFLSSDVAECYAICDALTFIKEMNIENSVIYTDSEQNFYKIYNQIKIKYKNYYLYSLIDRCQKLLKELNTEIRHIKGHCGVYGNTISDKLSKLATRKIKTIKNEKNS